MDSRKQAMRSRESDLVSPGDITTAYTSQTAYCDFKSLMTHSKGPNRILETSSLNESKVSTSRCFEGAISMMLMLILKTHFQAPSNVKNFTII